jgi:enoyl-[acyl-carrier protein] reductase II
VAGYKDALVAGGEDGTVISRAYSGKTMRVMRNAYTADWEHRLDELQRFPMQAMRSMQEGAFHLGGDESTDGVDPAIECYPAGQGVGGVDDVIPAGDVVRRIVAEAQVALGKAAGVMAPA